jgi:serpin B
MMKRWGAVACLVAALAADGGDAVAAESYAESNNAFAVDLYHRIAAQREGKNILFSPFSVTTALSMAWAGAHGGTADEMAAVLHYDPNDRVGPHAAIRALVDRLTSDPDERAFVVTVANDLWRDTRIAFRPAFAARMETYYGSPFHAIDFAGDPAGAADEIDRHIATATRGMIKKIVGDGSVTAATTAILTNAIYLKGVWERRFDKEATRDEAFFVTADESVTVPMMGVEGAFGYLRGDGFQAVELPYKGGRASMILFVPDAKDGLAAWEKRVSAKRLKGWIDLLSSQTVEVRMPKFRMEEGGRLRAFLDALGMKTAFTPDGDFAGMFEAASGRSFIGEVVHKARIDVDEEKTEAAAATAIIMMRTGLRALPRIVADHPYLFVIRDNERGAFLFMGRVANPRKAA